MKPGKRFLIGLVILLAFGLRLYQLDGQSLRGDEALSFIYGSQPLEVLFEVVREASVHPPLYYLSLHYWLPLTGPSEFSLRFFSVVAGTLLVVSIMVLGRVLQGWPLGIVSGLIAALNPYQIYYAQDARSYAWVALLGLWSTLALLKALRSDTWRAWLLYGGLVLAAMYTHYYFPFIVIAQGLFLLWHCWRQQRWPPWRYVAVGVLDLILYLPWFLLSFTLVSGYQGDNASVGFMAGIGRPVLAFAGGLLLADWGNWLLAIFAGLLLIFGVWGVQKRPGQILLLLYLFIPVVSIAFVAQFRPIFNERYLMMASPAYILLVGAGLLGLWRWRARWGQGLSSVLGIGLLSLGLMALVNYYENPAYAKSPAWRSAFDMIKREQNPATEALIYNIPEASMTYYVETYLARSEAEGGRIVSYFVPHRPDLTDAEIATQLAAIAQNYERLWLVQPQDSSWYDRRQVETWLTRYGDRIVEANFRWTRVDLYLTPSQISQTMTPQETPFANGLTLRGFQIWEDIKDGTLNLKPEETLNFSLYWTTAGPTTGPYTVFTQLIDPTGVLQAGQDNQPVWGTYPTTEWPPAARVTDKYRLKLQEGIPLGSYQLWVGLYDSNTGERVPVLDETGNPAGDYVSLSIPILVQE